MKNSFDIGPEGWCSYDYHASVVAGRNIFILTTWENAGGVNDSGYVWCDENRWSSDTPESPLSILPFIMYTSWVGGGAMDLRGAQVSVYLRGDGLKLDGADCYFWVHSAGTRWHYASRPLEIGQGGWASEPNVLTLANDETLWHRSWAGDPSNPTGLNDLLAGSVSYGISFVGFSQEVRGKFSMCDFEINPA